MGYWLLAVAPLVPLKTILLSPPERREEGGGRPVPSSEEGASQMEPSSTGAPSSLPTSNEAASSLSISDEAASSLPHNGGASALFRPLRTSDAALAATGVVAGFASGLLGIGGGTIVTPALALFTDMNQAQAGRTVVWRQCVLWMCRVAMETGHEPCSSPRRCHTVQ